MAELKFTKLGFSGSIRSAVRIDCHEDLLLSANHAKLLSLWDLRDGTLINSSPIVDGRISRVRLLPPYGLCLSWSPGNDDDYYSNSKSGVAYLR